MKRRPDLIVPVRDRRRGKRILTLRNFGLAGASTLLLFIAISIRSELRGSRPGEYGRIVDGETKHEVVAQPRVPVVTEDQPVPDHTSSDPLLLSSAAREGYLGDTALSQPTAASAMPSTSFAARRPMPTDGGVAIVGDANGVAIVKTPAEETKKLSGGIFRQ